MNQNEPHDQTPSPADEPRDEQAARPKCSACGTPLWPLLLVAIIAGLLIGPTSALFSGGAAGGGDGEVDWSDDIEQAKSSASEQGKPILLLFTDPATCPPCRRMDQETWTDEAVADLVNERFIPVRMEPGVPGRNDAALRYNIRFIPNMVLIDAEGNTLDQAGGGRDATELMNWLEPHAS